MGIEALTPDYRQIMKIVADADGPVMAEDVARALGRELTPDKVEPVRGQLRRLADRGRLARTGPLPAALTAMGTASANTKSITPPSDTVPTGPCCSAVMADST